MRLVSEQWGEPCNHLVITDREYYEVIKPFLNALGVRTRCITSWCENDDFVSEIQAENVYEQFCSSKDRSSAALLLEQ